MTCKFRDILIHFVNKQKTLIKLFCGCFVLQISCEKVIKEKEIKLDKIFKNICLKGRMLAQRIYGGTILIKT